MREVPATKGSCCPGCGVGAGGEPKRYENPLCSGCLFEKFKEVWEWYKENVQRCYGCDARVPVTNLLRFTITGASHAFCSKDCFYSYPNRKHPDDE